MRDGVFLPEAVGERAAGRNDPCEDGENWVKGEEADAIRPQQTNGDDEESVNVQIEETLPANVDSHERRLRFWAAPFAASAEKASIRARGGSGDEGHGAALAEEKQIAVVREGVTIRRHLGEGWEAKLKGDVCCF